jgi:DNA-binding MarR family transcriptional regulator
LQASGVTVAEWVVLREMFDAASLVPSELAESIGLTRGAVSKLVDRLLHKGLLTRIERNDDRRFQSIALTASGCSLVPKLAALADENDATFFASLSAKEREALVATLKKLVRANQLTKIPIE